MFHCFVYPPPGKKSSCWPLGTSTGLRGSSGIHSSRLGWYFFLIRFSEDCLFLNWLLEFFDYFWPDSACGAVSELGSCQLAVNSFVAVAAAEEHNLLEVAGLDPICEPLQEVRTVGLQGSVSVRKAKPQTDKHFTIFTLTRRERICRTTSFFSLLMYTVMNKIL